MHICSPLKLQVSDSACAVGILIQEGVFFLCFFTVLSQRAVNQLDTHSLPTPGAVHCWSVCMYMSTAWQCFCMGTQLSMDFIMSSIAWVLQWQIPCRWLTWVQCRSLTLYTDTIHRQLFDPTPPHVNAVPPPTQSQHQIMQPNKRSASAHFLMALVGGQGQVQWCNADL